MQKGLKIWLIIALIVAGVSGAYAYNTSQVKDTLNASNNKTATIDTTKISTEEKTQKFTASNDQNKELQAEKDIYDVKDIGRNMIGKTITVRGTVSNVKKPKDTTFFIIQDISNEKSINGVLFRKTDNDNTERKELLENSASTGNAIYIKGEVSEYKGNLQIKAWKVFTK